MNEMVSPIAYGVCGLLVPTGERCLTLLWRMKRRYCSRTLRDVSNLIVTFAEFDSASFGPARQHRLVQKARGFTRQYRDLPPHPWHDNAP